MPANVEIKARVHDMVRLHALVAALSDTPCTRLVQEDTVFNSRHGRLKLRVLSPIDGELIAYARANIAAPRPSTYERVRTTEPRTLQAVLTAALGVRGVVCKQRWVYRIGQTRVHLDDVEGLGHFVELEVVLHPGQDVAEGQQIAAKLMQQLGIRSEDLLSEAYIDMLLS